VTVDYAYSAYTSPKLHVEQSEQPSVISHETIAGINFEHHFTWLLKAFFVRVVEITAHCD